MFRWPRPRRLLKDFGYGHRNETGWFVCCTISMSRPVREDSAAGALRRLCADPVGLLVRRWNWKSALLSSLWRGLVFAVLAARGGWWAAGAAGGVEILLQAVAAGFSGAVTQAFHRVRPAWQGVGVAAVLILCIQHPLEFALHGVRGTPHWRSGILISMVFSVAAAAVNMGLMRRGYLMVGDGPPVGRRRLRRAGAPLGDELR